jgi:hypothetical protein
MKSFYILLIIATNVSICYGFLDYGAITACNTIPINLDYIKLHIIDAYVFVLIGPISLLSTMFIILTFIKFTFC